MLRNYLKIALRNLLRHKAFSLINVAGLAIGIAACLLILQYVTFEWSYDRFHPGAENIYRVEFDSYNEGKLAFRSATSFPGIAPAMKQAFPEVEEAIRLFDANENVVTYGNVKFRQDNFYHADPAVFKVLKIDLIKGDPATALKDPNSVTLSESMAKKYFGEEDPMGKTLKLGNDPYMVKGVFRDYPNNSHLELDLLFSYLTEPDAQTSWGWYDFFTYVKFKPGTDPKVMQTKLAALAKKYQNEPWRNAQNRDVFLLQPLTDIHLYSNLNQEAEVNGNGQAVNFLFAIALFILAIAWINYVNLATARAVERAKEVGIRKVVGAERTQLMSQFILESVLLNLLATLIALGIVAISLPYFNQLTGRQLTLALWSQGGFWALMFLGLVFGSLLAGLYPALVLSGFRPISVLKGRFQGSTRGLALRKSLIVFQFAASVVLIVGTLTVYKQLRYMQEQDLGFGTDQMLIIHGPEVVDSTYDSKASSFKTSLTNAGIAPRVTSSAYVPGIEILWTNGIRRKDRDDGHIVFNTAMDYDFVDTYGMTMAAGRNFSRSFGTDNKALLLNETATRMLNYDKPEDAVNQEIINGRDTLRVVGVVKDYHQQGLKTAYWPMIFRLYPNAGRFYSMKVKTAQLPQTLAAVQRQYDQFFPGNPFEYFFLDDFFNQQYQAEMQFGQVFSLFSGLAIFIACLGLLGLISFTASQRTKEIGIRKVLGANVTQIIVLLSKDFLKLVLVAIVLAVPLAWYLMDQWLANFAYRTNIGTGVFTLAGAAALLIALSTVSYRAYRAASANPVESLRTE